jgi:hypothetical protein
MREQLLNQRFANFTKSRANVTKLTLKHLPETPDLSTGRAVRDDLAVTDERR